MRLNLFSLLVAACAWGTAQGQYTVITGADPRYREVPVTLTLPGHPFMDLPALEESVSCDSTGAFRFELGLERGAMVRLKTGIYDGGLYAVPGQEYRVQLPPFREATTGERVSPYFEPLKVPLRVAGDPGDVNHRIFRFDSLFRSFNEQVILARRRGWVPPVDSLSEIMLQQFPVSPGTWFGDYTTHRIGVLYLNGGRTGLELVAEQFLGQGSDEMNPAFLELFGVMFKDFLVYYERTPEGKGIRYHINRTHQLDSLRHIVARHPAVMNDTLADLVLLQELPAMFYRGDFHKEAILILLDSMAADPVKPAFAKYARQERDKLASLVIGHPPPGFRLPDLDGNICSPGDFKGKYLYLFFCTPDQYGCMMEYPFLQSYHEKHASYLQVVSVMVSGQPGEVRSFMERNHYSWKALCDDGSGRLLDDYLIKAFPVAYLVGPDGKLVLSPAPLPTDGFEQQLFRIMRSRGEI